MLHYRYAYPKETYNLKNKQTNINIWEMFDGLFHLVKDTFVNNQYVPIVLEENVDISKYEIK